MSYSAPAVNEVSHLGRLSGLLFEKEIHIIRQV